MSSCICDGLTKSVFSSLKLHQGNQDTAVVRKLFPPPADTYHQLPSRKRAPGDVLGSLVQMETRNSTSLFTNLCLKRAVLLLPHLPSALKLEPSKMAVSPRASCLVEVTLESRSFTSPRVDQSESISKNSPSWRIWEHLSFISMVRITPKFVNYEHITFIAVTFCIKRF